MWPKEPNISSKKKGIFCCYEANIQCIFVALSQCVMSQNGNEPLYSSVVPLEETGNKQVMTEVLFHHPVWHWPAAATFQPTVVAWPSLSLSQDTSTGCLVVIDERCCLSRLSFTATSTAPAHGHLSSVGVCAVWGRPERLGGPPTTDGRRLNRKNAIHLLSRVLSPSIFSLGPLLSLCACSGFFIPRQVYPAYDETLNFRYRKRVGRVGGAEQQWA